MTMNALNNGLKTLACGVGALAITAVLSWSLVSSTSTCANPNVGLAATAPAHTTHMATVSIQQRHMWFGQSQPAVLVD
jgi:hypothetical protein